MNQSFQHKNEGFTCENCNQIVPDATGTCRNHCTHCLHSKHVDNFPGDREAHCKGKLKPIGVSMKRGTLSDIHFVCLKCGKKGVNKIASDDNREALLILPLLSN